ncbi:ORF6N domain-containing protein [Candidatus Peregrinibacteria bacterium]|nr:ORF6N domain-containing protein [Candidatus Peregrinibacteria bacterium]
MPEERIESKILYLRRKKVMLDSSLAVLYDVETKVLNQAVRRNIKRFPGDFMFRLNKFEMKILRSQIVTLKKGHGQHKKYLPYAFTEQGVAMLSSVLNSERAIKVNIQIMRTFTRLREMLATHRELKEKIEKLEKKYDKKFAVVFEVMRKLLAPEEKPKPPIGFKVSR